MPQPVSDFYTLINLIVTINHSALPREFYLIAHGINDKAKIRRAFKQKVNGIECDLWCDSNKKWWISHDGIFKTDLVTWLDYIGEAESKYQRKLALIIFDTKQAEPYAGVRELINRHLPSDLPRVYSVAALDMAHIFRDVVGNLSQFEAISIDEEDDPEEVAAFFNDIGTTQCWYGNGITLFLVDNAYHDCMQKAASMRDTTGPFSKVYTWSIHHKEAMRKYILEDGVDGMMVGLNSLLTRPVSKAMKIIKRHNITLATRKTKLF